MSFTPPGQSRPFPLQSTANVALTGIKVMAYGGAGVGKTRLCATAPSPVIFSAESGLLSLRGYNIPYHVLGSYTEMVDAYNWTVGSQEAQQFATICIDSISEIAEQILGGERGEEAAKKSPNYQRAYGEMALKVMDLLRRFRDIPGRNIYFSAKMGRLKDEQTGSILWGPLMPGQQIDQQLPYFVDEVFHIARYPAGDGTTVPGLRTQPDNQYQAKDRSGALAPLEHADLTAIFNKIAQPVAVV